MTFDASKIIGMTSETVSVAMCTYNGAEHIDAQVVSILSQSRLPDELIISDDGSVDGTVERLVEIAKTAPIPIRVLHSYERLGVSRNFERAIAACTGSVIALADQDDIWSVEKVQSILAAFAPHPDCGYVFSDANLIDNNGKCLGTTLWNIVGFVGERRQRYEANEQLTVMLRGGNFVYGMALAFRARLRGLLLPIIATSADCTHDTWIATLLSAAGHRGIALPEPLVAYRQHARQVVGAGEYNAGSWRAIRGVLTTDKRAARTLADDYQAMSARLRQDGPHEVAVAHLEGKALHLKRRQLAIETPRLFRISGIATELFSGRYTSYSTSWKSALRDLVA